jgi:hypothetical protein
MPQQQTIRADKREEKEAKESPTPNHECGIDTRGCWVLAVAPHVAASSSVRRATLACPLLRDGAVFSDRLSRSGGCYWAGKSPALLPGDDGLVARSGLNRARGRVPCSRIHSVRYGRLGLAPMVALIARAPAPDFQNFLGPMPDDPRQTP